ncbi:DEAD/DEAH box helicase [Pseudactinotalea sp. HY158]|uniref:DEAD/DEAH box helicase n=1 Tax=unclassified Pseudactinotalea TaxID=2649176 RepID=UPI001E55BA73|nr:DEAD/DEAH box helicase [Pseudactinotalea sp. HY158]
MTTFADLGLSTAALDRVASLGFTTPTDIQIQAIPVLLAGSDVVGVAQTGTGKTAAFGLPLLARVDADLRQVQALVLTPTRELAMQVADAVAELGDRAIEVLPVYGGSPFGPQLRGLAGGAQVVVGTPGRVIDMIERGALDLSTVRYVVLDEADEMLRMGFAEDVDQILAGAARDRQTALFSATMPATIRRVARTHMHDPVEVTTSPVTSATRTITQQYAVVPFRHKVGALGRILETTEAEAAIIFVRTRKDADEVGAQLSAQGINAASISGDVAQRDRERIVERLRSGRLDVLVATDVAARGLDVERIGLVVNYDVPREVEAYVHRIGRTGRAGRAGTAFTFFTPKEAHRLRQIEKVTGSKLVETAVPSPAQVSAHKARAVLAAVPERIGSGRLESYREQLTTLVAESSLDLLDVAAALVAAGVGDSGPRRIEHDRRESRAGETERFDRTDRFDRSPASSASSGREDRGRFDRQSRPDRSDRPDRRDRGTRFAGSTVYRVSVGRNHGVRPEGIVGAVTGEAGLRGSDLGKITINSTFSLVEISADLDSDQLHRLDRAMVAGKPLRLRADTGRAPRDFDRSSRSRERSRESWSANRRPNTHGGERRAGERRQSWADR